MFLQELNVSSWEEQNKGKVKNQATIYLRNIVVDIVVGFEVTEKRVTEELFPYKLLEINIWVFELSD